MSQDLIARLEAIEAEAASLRAELAKAQEPKPWARWKPKENQRYYFLSDSGELRMSIWDGGSLDHGRFAFGNVHPTPEAAERHAKRLRSMVPTCPVPKEGDTVWVADYDGSPFPTTWGGRTWQSAAYNQGRIKPTEKDANAWVAEFANAWTKAGDAS